MVDVKDLTSEEKFYLMKRVKLAYYYDPDQSQYWRLFHQQIMVHGAFLQRYPDVLHGLNKRWEDMIKNKYYDLEEGRARYLKQRQNDVY